MAPTMSKKEADYRIPVKTSQPCRNCDMYSRGRCDLVKGEINSEGTCKHYVHTEK